MPMRPDPPPVSRAPAGPRCVACGGSRGLRFVRGAVVAVTLRTGYGAEECHLEGVLCQDCFPMICKWFSTKL
jgi:hypothetical protein